MDAGQRRARLDRLSIEAQQEIAEGSADKGVEICRELIAEWTSIQGPEGDQVLVWRGFLGRALTEANRYQEAETVLWDLLVDRERLLGPDDPSVFVTRGNLARVIALSGRTREAMFHAERLLADRTRILGPDHPSTLDSFGHIAAFHYQEGDFATAAEMYEELLERRIRVLGEDHHDVFQTEHNLVASLAKLGTPEAIAENRAMAMELQNELGFDHLNTLNAFSLLADALLRVGEAEEALEIGNSILDGFSRVLGDTDPKTLSARGLVLKALLKLGRWNQAIDEVVRILHFEENSGRGDHNPSVNAITSLFNNLTKNRRVRLQVESAQRTQLLHLADRLVAYTRRSELADDYAGLAHFVTRTFG